MASLISTSFNVDHSAARTDTVTVNGSYVENTSGTGDYTKGDQEYYPIRNDVDADKQQSEKFRENIQSFEESTSSDARGAYYCRSFQPQRL